MELTPVQLSLWDIEITQSVKKVTKKTKSLTKTEGKITEKADSFTVLERYKDRENISRIIQYCGGGFGIELQLEDSFKSIYVNKEGHEEFTKDKKLPVLPMDKILFYREDLQANSLQEGKLQELKTKNLVAKEIRRKGDENIILELQDKVISINTEGWVLEFNNVEVAYVEDEVVKEERQALQDIKIGDIIETTYGKEIISAEVYSIYNCGSTLNIIWDKKHTAIPMCAVKKIIKCA